MSRRGLLNDVADAAVRAELKHNNRWCGSTTLNHAQRLAIVMSEMGEVADEVVAGNDVRMREEVLDALGALLGWLEVLT